MRAIGNFIGGAIVVAIASLAGILIIGLPIALLVNLVRALARWIAAA